MVHRKQGRPEGRDSKLGYVPGLDGLRALAVMAVLIYHAQYSWMPGGFLGVEIFFVISGYLITSLLLKEWQETQGINLLVFWMRRARRLLPALFLLIVSVLAAAVIFLPEEVAALRSDALAATFYVTNWYYILINQSYFEAVGRPSLFKHLWSLAIEEQFYVLWPLLLVAMLRRWPHRRVLLAVVMAAAGSIALMAFLYPPNADPSRVYYGTDTRAAGLLIGSALAFVWMPSRLPGWSGKLPLDAIGVAALGVITLFCMRTNQFSPALYRGGFAILALTTAVLIAVTVHPQSRLSRILAWTPFVWIGLRSYGIYLWHWPVYMVTRPQLDVQLDGLPLLMVRLLVTFGIAALSYYFVESPIRSGALGRSWRLLRETNGSQHRVLATQWTAGVGALLFFLMVLSVTVVQAQPPPLPAYLAVTSVNTIGLASTPTAMAHEASPVPTPTVVPAMPTSTQQPAAAPIEPTATLTAQSAAVTTASATSSPTASPPTSPLLLPEGQPSPTHAPGDPDDDMLMRPAHPRQSQLTPIAASEDTTTPSPTPTPTCVTISGGPVTALGESVMIAAIPDLQRAICNIQVDAAQGRPASSAIDALREYRANGQLGAVVIIHIGNNGILTSQQFDEIMAILEDVRRVIFLNIKVPREWQAPNNTMLADNVKRYRNAVLVDWYGATTKRPGLFWSDGIHLRPEGARYYAELILAASLAP